MLRSVLFAAAILSVSTSLALVAAPKPGEDEGKGDKAASPRNDQAKPSASGQWKNSDHCFASCVALGNQEEVALGQIAVKKSQNEDVKQFAAMLVADHHKFLEKLEKFAPEATQPGYLESNTQEARAAGRSEIKQAAATEEAGADAKIETTAGTKEGEHSKRAFKQAQIERELAQECLKASREKLEAKSGAEFDKCFIGQQLAMHAGMRVKLIVYQRHASSELAEVLAAGQKKTEEHLAKAEEIIKSLDRGTSVTSK